MSNVKTDQLRHSLYAEVSARNLVASLLKQRPDGRSIEDVYSEASKNANAFVPQLITMSPI